MDAKEIRVIAGGALKELLPKLARELEQRGPVTLKYEFSPPAELKRRVLQGEPFDIVIIAEDVVRELIQKGKIVPDSLTPLFSISTGVAIRAGAAKPGILSIAEFRKALLEAKSIAYSDPSTGAVSGELFEKILRQLGISREIRSKAILNRDPANVHNAELVARGEAELAIQTIGEILAVPGVEFLGPVPQELQEPVLVCAGVVVQERTREAQAVVQMLRALVTSQR
jgi:molybdate transport system substrate-binding protein